MNPQKMTHMTCCITIVVCLITTLCTEVVFAQAEVSASTPAAFVYVSSRPNSNYKIKAFAADLEGKLTRVPGSPSLPDVQFMALNGKYLFGANGIDIHSFSIGPNGALQKVASINAHQFNGYNCGGPIALFLDHSGTTLYDLDYNGDACANNAYQSFSIDSSTGELTYLGISTASTEFQIPLSFIGNNVYAYGSGCFHFEPSIYGFKRNGNATLTDLNIHQPLPVAKDGDFYCTSLATADATYHAAISVQAFNAQSWQADGTPQLATYTADGSGNLSTKSTFSNMPETAVQSVRDIAMSPSGKLLAVAGAAGLQVFRFRGKYPITHYTGLLTNNRVDQLAWDRGNHLYAISRSAGKLFVFTITPTSVRQAPGSPYAITNPQNIAVLPKT
jgi:hypothetical protein